MPLANNDKENDKLKRPDEGPSLDPGGGSPPRLVLPRLAPLPARVDIGEQIVGSEHVFTIARPTLLAHGQDGFVTAEVMPSRMIANPFKSQLGLDPAPAMAVTARAFEVDASVFRPNLLGHDSEPIRVRFVPTASGLHAATLIVTIEWNDGTTERHSIELYARAREIDQLPDKAIPDPTPKVHEGLGVYRDQPAGRIEELSKTDVYYFATAATEAVEAAANLAREQDKGVHIAEEQAKSYKKAPPESPWWAELIELAVSMGVAGVAGVIAKKLGPRLATALRSSATKDSGLAIGITDGLKDGLKAVGKSVAGHARSHGHAQARSPARGEFSSNSRIEFFAQQSSLLSTIENKNADLLAEQREAMVGLLREDPRAAIAAMTAIAESLREARDGDAIQLQQIATEQQWIAAVARSNLGGDRVFDPAADTHRTVTDMTPLRFGRGDRSGVVTLEVVLPIDAIDTSRAVVRSASLTGLSQEIADRLLATPLLAAGVPVLLVVHTGASTAWITRDEAGRIRITGSLPHEMARDRVSEAQMYSVAAELCERMLGKSLDDWGVGAVKSDDATGRGD